MTDAAAFDRAQRWIVGGDANETLAALAAEVTAGRLSEVDRVRAAWWLRQFGGECDAPALAGRLLTELDPRGTLPSPMTVVELRFWARNAAATWGALGRLARAAGMHSADVSRLKLGGSLSPAKCERLAAAIIVAGRSKPASVQQGARR